MCVNFPTVFRKPENELVKQTFEEALDESSLGVDQFSEPRIGGPSWPKQGSNEAKVSRMPPYRGTASNSGWWPQAEP